MSLKACFALVVCALLTGCGLPVQHAVDAAESHQLMFTLVGPQQTITFALPVSPTPDGYANECAFNQNTFCNRQVPVSVNGEIQTLTTTFYGNGGLLLAGHTATTTTYLDFAGPHLFTGSLTEPTLTPGDYTLFTTDLSHARETYTLTVVAQSSK